MISADPIVDSIETCCFNDGLETDGMHHTEQVVVFENEDCCTSVIRGKHFAPNPLHIRDKTSITELTDYLSRPFAIGFGAFDQIALSNMIAISLQYTPYFSRLPNWYKLDNVLGFRATVVFKLQVLATPQHSGILRMTYEPFIGTRNTAVSPLGISYLPHAQLNLADNTEMTFKIPFIQRQNWFYNKTNTTLGQFSLFNLTPAGLATGVLPAKYRLWTWLEDIELQGTAPSSVIVNQSGRTKLSTSVVHKPSAPAKEVPPANLSSILSSASHALRFIGKNIPSLASFTGAPAWALGTAAGWAASFGWAKPRSTSTVMKIFRSRNTYQHNVDGIDNSYNLALAAENSLAASAMGGTQVDEMSFGYTNSRWGILSTISLAAQATDTFLYRMRVAPKYWYWTGTDNIVIQPLTGTIQPTQLLYLADDFQVWRGTTKVKLTVGSTKFHNARLVVGFIPTQNNTIVIGDTYGTDYLQVIWDLKSQTTLEFDIPYINPSNFLDVALHTGTFFIKVLDTLVYPTNVAASVTILVEIAGGEDFEVAIPRTPTLFSNQSGNNIVTTTTYSSPAELCVGEKVLSCKQLISRAMFSTIVPMNTNILFSNLNMVANTAGSNLLKWKACYAMWRGSYNYHFLSNSPSSQITAMLSNPIGAYYDFTSNIMVSEDKSLHVSIPFYSTNPTVTKNSVDSIAPTLVVYTRNPAVDASASYAVYARAGDDTQYYYYIGPPVCTIRPNGIPTLNTQFTTWASGLVNPALVATQLPAPDTPLSFSIP